MSKTSNEQQLELLLELISNSVNSKVSLNSKLLRDILDVVEGLMRGILNSMGKYDHSALKLNCEFVSEKAAKLKAQVSRSKLLKETHREHAVPLKVVIDQLYKISNLDPEKLKQFLNENLISVLITKEEQISLDSKSLKIRNCMPHDWDGKDAFARFHGVGIRIQSKKIAT